MQRYVVVTGLPGSGKTTLALALGRALGLPVLSKDVIKEALHEVFPAADEPGSQLLGAAGFEVLWALVPNVPSAVLETYWHPRSYDQLRSLRGTTIEVFCDCPKAMCAERFLLRRGADRHPAHGEHFLDPAAVELNIAAWPESSPIGVGRLVRVDTTRPVDVQLVARQVIAASR